MKYFNAFIKVLLSVILLLMTALTFYQVIMRYVFNNQPSWTEEVVRFLFVYVSMIGAGIGIREKAHIGIDVVINLFPVSIRKGAAVLVHGLIAVFGGFIVRYSLGVMEITRRQKAPATGLPMNYVYLAVLIFGVLCILYSCLEIFTIIRNWKKEGEPC